MSDEIPVTEVPSAPRDISAIVGDVLKLRREANDARKAVIDAENELANALNDADVHLDCEILVSVYAYNDATRHWGAEKFIIARDDIGAVTIRAIREAK